MSEVAFFLKVDANDNWVVAEDADKLEEHWTDDVGDGEVGPTMIYMFVVAYPKPLVREIRVEIPEGAEGKPLTIKVQPA